MLAPGIRLAGLDTALSPLAVILLDESRVGVGECPAGVCDRQGTDEVGRGPLNNGVGDMVGRVNLERCMASGSWCIVHGDQMRPRRCEVYPESMGGRCRAGCRAPVVCTSASIKSASSIGRGSRTLVITVSAGSCSAHTMPQSAACCTDPTSTYEVIATSAGSSADTPSSTFFAHHLYVFGDAAALSPFQPSSVRCELFDRFQATHYCSDLSASAMQAALQPQASGSSCSPQGGISTATIILSLPVHTRGARGAVGAGVAAAAGAHGGEAAHDPLPGEAGGATSTHPSGRAALHGLQEEEEAARTAVEAAAAVCRTITAVRHAAGPSAFIVLWHPDAVEDPVLRLAAFEGGANMVGAASGKSGCWPDLRSPHIPVRTMFLSAQGGPKC